MKLPELSFLRQRRTVIVQDMRFKMDAEDWHGVADAAMDLREIDAQLAVLDALSRRAVTEWGALEALEQ
jgi:hypothetical protein